MFSEKIKQLAQKIMRSDSFILTTHKSCDADGLGSILAFHHVLTGQGKAVQSLSVDAIPSRYDFMNHKGIVDVFKDSSVSVKKADTALIFDTNDSNLIEPLYSELKKQCKEIIFIDHHCFSENSLSSADFVSEDSASTGEICYALFEEMSVPIDQKTAQAVYTSIIFDTRMFRSSKNLSKAFYTCSKLCDKIGSHDIYENLFCTYDHQSWDQMPKILSHVRYSEDEKIGWIELNYNKFKQSGLKIFYLMDFLDLVMKRQSVVVGVLSVEKKPQQYKISLRSKGDVDVNKVVQFFGGGGHLRSAGMTLNDYPKNEILKQIKQAVSIANL